jgi:prepilin-type N-terminal cleavage/methylation domain-containing protein
LASLITVAVLVWDGEKSVAGVRAPYRRTRMRRLRSHLQAGSGEAGMTLVELLVVCAIMGILAGISVSMITTLFDTNIRAQQLVTQQQTISSMGNFLSAKLASAQRPLNALTKSCGAATCIDYRSVGPDQFLFSSGDATSSTTCYRVMWIADLQQIRVSSLPGRCTYASQPKRLPNQTIGQAFADISQSCPVTPNNYCSLYRLPTSEKTNPQYSAVYDAPLDDLIGTGSSGASYLLADAIPSTMTGQPALTPFVFKDDNGTILPFSYSSKTGAPYDRTSNLNSVSSVTVTAYVAPTLIGQPNTQVVTRVFTQQYALQQLCAATAIGGSGVTPGSIYYQTFVLGNPTQSSTRTVSQGTTYSTVNVGDVAQTPLQSGEFGQQNQFINFQGEFNVAGPTSGSVGETDVRATLYKKDNPSDTPAVASDDNGKQSYTYAFRPMVANPIIYTTVPLQGGFQVHLNSRFPNRTYQVRIEIRSLSSGTITYSTAASDIGGDPLAMRLNTQWIAST